MADLAQQLEGVAVEIDTDALWAVQENDIAALLRRTKGEITALRTQLADARTQERERCAKVICRLCSDGVELVPHDGRPYGGWHQITELGGASDGGTDYEECAALIIRALSPTPNQEKKE